jgi:hypothetical protein
LPFAGSEILENMGKVFRREEKVFNGEKTLSRAKLPFPVTGNVKKAIFSPLFQEK